MSVTVHRTTWRLRQVIAISCLFVALLVQGIPAGAKSTQSKPVRAGPDTETLRAWITEMKDANRGPFSRIRWFCKDGVLLPPGAFACQEHGGGVQHGEWTARVKELRAAGYYIANVLADTDIETTAQDRQLSVLAHILVEQYLQRVDDGWIFRKARFYRGALQEEGERAGSRELLLALLADPARVQKDFAVIRIAAQLLGHGTQTPSATAVRQISADLSGRDRKFQRLRNKIHVKPGPEDAHAVRAYAKSVSSATLRDEYGQLAQAIDALYDASALDNALTTLARERDIPVDLATRLRNDAKRLGQLVDMPARYALTGRLLGALRDALGSVPSPRGRLKVLDLSLQVEAEHFAAAVRLRDQPTPLTRQAQLRLLAAGGEAIYGTGLIRQRQRDALRDALATVSTPASVVLAEYKGTIDYLNSVPAWASARLRFHFSQAVETFHRLEPKAVLFVDDQMRGSPLFAFSHVLDRLARDANRLAGVRNELFGENVGAGLRALNPGLAKGRLLKAGESLEELSSDGIYILPETISELPPVAGILTAGEGNPLSHVQLLARNLGIPNVGIEESLFARLEPFLNQDVILAVSPAGSVRLAQASARSADLFEREQRAEQQSLIRPDLGKLDLTRRAPVTLSELRATDSGRTVGPKAAKLGELKFAFPKAVADGVAIPFGVFKALLDRPHPTAGVTVFEWMKAQYRRLASLPRGSAQRNDETERFRSALYDWILSATPSEQLLSELDAILRETFGPDGSYGVFVRSDTNVEDLPGFTGAGLNLTVPNVVGVDAIFAAIPRVWASPFTARAFAWRQAHMDEPEHVYPAVLLLRSVPVEKSGVLVTQDIDTGRSGWLSVAINEGVGGAVDGQAAESLRIDMATARVRLLAQATATVRREVSLKGGVTKVPSSDTDTVLLNEEVAALIDLVKVLPAKFPEIVNDAGQIAPADIEFGFLEGELKLFQIRPFLESAQARGSEYLKQLDSGLQDLANVHVDMTESPQ